MDLSEFETLVQKGFQQLPARVRKKIKNVALLVENEPSPEVREREGLGFNDTLLGYYQGVPLSVREYGASMILPDTITLYKLPIEKTALELNKTVLEVITETIWHEYAHHFGMDEEEVCAREREKFK